MNRLVSSCFLLAMFFAALASIAHADQLDDETRRIGRQLQCPVCSGAAVSDSPSELAGQMRNVIRAKLEAGESEEQIIAYFVERYGDSVLIEPPRRGIGLAVWIAPIGMLAIGVLLLWRLLQIWLRPVPMPRSVSGVVPETPDHNSTVRAVEPTAPSAVDRARAELERFRREA
jgi:cytochrome c-type biogenesis protein CcmH